MNDELDYTKVFGEPIWGGQLYVEYIIDITEAEYEDTTSRKNSEGKFPTLSGFEYRSMKTIL